MRQLEYSRLLQQGNVVFSAEWLHLQYFTKIHASQKYAADTFCKKYSMSTLPYMSMSWVRDLVAPMHLDLTLPYKRAQKSGKNRFSVLDDARLTSSWNASGQNNISCCDKHLHAAREIPLRDHKAQRVRTKSRDQHFYQKTNAECYINPYPANVENMVSS